MGFALSDIELSSSSFVQGGSIPKKHTGEAEDSSPPLQWRNPPAGTLSYAVVCHDPDAPLVKNGTYGYVHWVLYNLPASCTSLEENTQLGTGGLNDFGTTGYGGPLPPPGHGTHLYYFWILALDSELDLAPGLTLGQLLETIEPHLLGMNRLVGSYRRD